MADSTAIATLPMTNNTVRLEVTDKSPPAVHLRGAAAPRAPAVPSSLPADAMTQALQGIQRASMTGMTQLPSRDIPMATQQLTQDEQTRLNYIPPAPRAGYIEQHDSYRSVIDKSKQQRKKVDRVDLLYEELHLPVLAMVIFMLFQMPIAQKKMLHFFPSFFLKDGNKTIGGHFLKTVLFGFTFYGALKASKYASEL